jgi:hypothetical protein
VIRNRSIGTAPVEESRSCIRDLIINSRRAPEIRFFVHLTTVEIENPGFDIPLWNEMDNSLSLCPCWQSFSVQALSQLA